MKNSFVLAVLLLLVSCDDELVVPVGHGKTISKCIAHRGNVATSLENSMSAIRDSYQMGADGAEFDIQHTRDGIAIVNHDSTFAKTARNKPGKSCPKTTPIEELDWEELSTNCELTNGEELPTFELVLKTYKDRDFTLLFDFKSTPNAKTISTIQKYYEGMYHKVVSLATFAINVDEAFALRRKMPNKLYITSSRFMVGTENGFDGVEAREISDMNISYLQQKGLGISIYGYDDYSSMKHFMEKNVHYITTDDMEACKRAKL